MHGQCGHFSSLSHILILLLQIFFDPSPIGVDYPELVQRAEALPDPILIGGSRLVVHIQTTQAAVDDLLDLLRIMAAEKKAAGFVYSSQANGNANGNIYIRARQKSK